MQALKNYIYENCRLITESKANCQEIQNLKEEIKIERENMMNLNA